MLAQPMTQRRWSYTTGSGASAAEAWVCLDGDAVTSSLSTRKPDPQRRSLLECFEQGAYFDAFDPTARAELVAELASRIDPSALRAPIDRDRAAYLRALDPARLRPERFAYVLLREDHSVRESFAWLVDRDGVRVFRDGLDGDPAHVLADECFVAGPPTHSAPAWHREQLRAKLYAAQRPERALSLERAAPLVRYRAIERRDWSWDAREDGESFAGTFPGFVLTGYQYGHDYGTGSLVPEHVLRAPWATRISLHQPSSVLAEIRAVLAAAGLEDRAPSPASPAERAHAYQQLAPRMDRAAKWLFADTLELIGIARVQSEAQWQGGVAAGLFASLCPERPLSEVQPIERAQRMYGFGTDAIWLSTEGAAIVRASHCFGAWAGGVDEWWHIAPSSRARVAFGLATDYGRDSLQLVLGADTDHELAALRAHCLAYFALMGLRAP